MGRAIAIGMATLAGCYNPTIHGGSPCTSDSDCPIELKCVAGSCGGSVGMPDDGAPAGKDAHYHHVDAAYFDAPGTKSIDAARPPDGGPAACANYDLGSALGAVVAGTTNGRPNSYNACESEDSPDVSYAWTAPATAQYTIDVCSGHDQDFDSVLYVRDGSCTGMQIACNDDGCGSSYLSRVHVSLTAGELVIIIVDGYDDDQGSYTLTITQD